MAQWVRGAGSPSGVNTFALDFTPELETLRQNMNANADAHRNQMNGNADREYKLLQTLNDNLVKVSNNQVAIYDKLDELVDLMTPRETPEDYRGPELVNRDDDDP